MENLRLLTPEIVLTGLGLLMILADPFSPRRSGKRFLHWTVLACACVLGLLAATFTDPGRQGEGAMWSVDPLSQFFKALTLAAVVLVAFLSIDSKRFEDRRMGVFCGLLLLSAAGLMFLVSAVDLLLVFLSLELVSICSFILVGFNRADPKAAEGAIKYFLFGAFSSALMVFGLSLFYGAVGTTNLLAPVPPYAYATSFLFLSSVLLLVVGFGFKVSMAPFHFWVPDAYEAAPTPITAYLSVAPKAAGLAMMLRVLTKLIPHPALDLSSLFAMLAMLTMTVGNLTAIFQDNVKRLLAYSSIAQAGYMLIGFVAADALGREALVFYALVYTLMNVGAFAVAIAVANERGGERGYHLDAYDGMAGRSLGLSLAMLVFLLSLAGIPPLAGFVGKFYLFAAAVNGGWYGLALVAVLNSVASVYYYMRIAYRMFFSELKAPALTKEACGEEHPKPVAVGIYLYGALALALAGTLLIGALPEPFMALAKASAEIRP
jgi:NADH-quinone oxidoreductase subunit N